MNFDIFISIFVVIFILAIITVTTNTLAVSAIVFVIVKLTIYWQAIMCEGQYREQK
jgi:hypothetical protein